MAFYAFKAMRAAALAAAVALVLSSCGKGGDAAQGGQPAGREAPAPVVGVVTVHPQTVALTVELPGRLESLRTAMSVRKLAALSKNACSKKAVMSVPDSRCIRSTVPLMKQIWKARARNWQRLRQRLPKRMRIWRDTSLWLPPKPSAGRNTMLR